MHVSCDLRHVQNALTSERGDEEVVSQQEGRGGAQREKEEDIVTLSR